MDGCDLLCLDLDAAEVVRARLDVEHVKLLAAAAKTLSDPTRLLILHALAQRELCGCDLGWVTGQSDKTISHHLRRLRGEGLVTSRREGKVVFAALTDLGATRLATFEGLVA